MQDSLTSMCMFPAKRLHCLMLLFTLATVGCMVHAQSSATTQRGNAETPSLIAVKPPPLNPEHTANTHQLDMLIAAHHFKAVRMITEARIKVNPKDGEAFYFLSRVKFAYQQSDEAIELAEKAVAISPNNADYHCQLAKSVGDKARYSSFFEKAKLAKIMKREGDMALQIDPLQEMPAAVSKTHLA